MEDDWGSKNADLRYVKEYQPDANKVKHLQVLVYGPVGAGKSSFINSVTTAVLGRMAIPAAVGPTHTAFRYFTAEYKTHKLKKGRGLYLPVIFSDVMGLEDGDMEGVRVEDIMLAMEGHVKEGYKFNPACLLMKRDLRYNQNPSMDDRVHVLVCVVSANCPQIRPSLQRKMKRIQGAATDLGIPQVVIFTHIDEACAEIQKDVKNVYKSSYLKQKMVEFSSEMGIPLDRMFPVKNYTDGDNDDDMDTLILKALRQIITRGDAFINSM